MEPSDEVAKLMKYIVSSDYPRGKEVKEMLITDDLPDAIVTFMQCVHAYPECVFILSYYGNEK